MDYLVNIIAVDSHVSQSALDTEIILLCASFSEAVALGIRRLGMLVFSKGCLTTSWFSGQNMSLIFGPD